MGVRSAQFIGLNSWASALIKGCGLPHLAGEEIVKVAVSGCHRVEQIARLRFEPCVREEPGSERWRGIDDYGDGTLLPRYVFRRGKILQEKVQLGPWTSSPCIFTALVDERGSWVQKSLWTDDEMDYYSFLE